MSRSLPTHILVMMVLGTWSCDGQGGRNALNTRAHEASLGENVAITVQGASLVNTVVADEPGDAHRVTIRAQSLDVRLDLETKACGPTLLHVDLTQMTDARLETTYRIFLDTLSEGAEAVLSALSAGLASTGDVHESDALPLTNELTFEVRREASNSAALQWTLCTNRQGLHAIILPGHATLSDCGPLFAVPKAPCAEFDGDLTGRLPTATMRARLRIRNRVEGPFSFAVWGNMAGRTEVLDQVIEAVNDAEPAFAIISGDLTKGGRARELEAMVEHLEAGLTVPWFSTLGDRDLQGNAQVAYAKILGASNFAFDVGMVRVIVLDSAERALGLRTQKLLDQWLPLSPLAWPGDPQATGRVVVTHVSPFDPIGSRGMGFRDRNEGATVTAKLLHNGASHLFTSHLATFRDDDLKGMRLIHSGGAGAPLEADSSPGHHWLLVRVDPRCESPATAVRCSAAMATCPCMEVLVQPVD